MPAKAVLVEIHQAEGLGHQGMKWIKESIPIITNIIIEGHVVMGAAASQMLPVSLRFELLVAKRAGHRVGQSVPDCVFMYRTLSKPTHV